MQKEENLEIPSQNKAEEVKRQGTSKARKAQCGARLPNRRGGVWLCNPLYAPLSGRVARPIHSLFPIYLCSPSVRGHSPSRLSKWLLMRLLKSPSVPSGTSLFFRPRSMVKHDLNADHLDSVLSSTRPSLRFRNLLSSVFRLNHFRRSKITQSATELCSAISPTMSRPCWPLVCYATSTHADLFNNHPQKPTML